MESRKLLEFCIDKAMERKAAEITSMDLSQLSLICDYFLLLSANNKRHCQAIADSLREELSHVGAAPLRIEGYRDAGWVLLDCGSVVVHVFQQEERHYYNLERLWGDAIIEHHGDIKGN
ncbi:MAG: ribosome silencing factor [Clostridiales bacterium]|nr:ribosome silencing factor [Clostridiales bacterium]